MNVKESTCKSCEYEKQRPRSGRYLLTCLECCARLVMSAHPSKAHAAAMLAAIARQREAPARGQIVALVRERMQGKG